MKCFQLIVIFGLFAERKAECPLSPEYFQETKPVQAVSGKNIVLPCFPKFNLSVGHHILEWHFYEKEIYTFEKKGLVQEEKYNNRLFTSTEELEKGNASIQLCDVKESDAGEYCCCIVTTPVPLPKCTKMNLDKMNWMKYVKEIIIIIVVVVVVVIVVVIVIVIICFMVLIYNVITIIIKCFLFQRQGKISCRGQERGQPNSPNIESIEEEQMELIEKNKR